MSVAADRFIASHTGVVPAVPFLKWAGGKASLLPELMVHVPEKFGLKGYGDHDYYEPFLGGGALFFHLYGLGRLRGGVQLGDASAALMSMYRALRDDVDGVITALAKMTASYHQSRSNAYYYSQRVAFNKKLGRSEERAARLIFLNKTCFNGLYRVNLDGDFNVPAGKFKNKPAVLDEANLRRCSEALRNASLQIHDFARTTYDAQRGDLVYFDPPYWPASESANFTAYAKDPFGPAQQEALRDEALRLKARGVRVLLSNADVPEVHKLYRHGFEKRRVLARRNINSKAKKRGPVGELLIW